MSISSPPIRTFADFLDRIGDIPSDRIRFQPAPGTATLQDVLAIQEHEGRLCELVEGVLVEKVMGYKESRLAGYLFTYLNVFIMDRNLGILTPPDGLMELAPHLVRIPDIAFCSWDRLPDRAGPTEAVPRLGPNLAVEILSKSNTRGEMAAKRRDYFAAGAELVWEIDPEKQLAVIYTSPTQATTLGITDQLDGGTVLPGFTLELKKLFADMERRG